MDFKIVEYFLCDEQEYWLEKIYENKWGGSEPLYNFLTNGTFHKTVGETAQLFLLTEGKELVGYCTFAPRDNIPTTLTPWIGFLFIVPEYRGFKYSQILIKYVEEKAKEAGYKTLNVSSYKEGFFEQYDFSFYKMMVDVESYDLRVYQKALA